MTHAATDPATRTAPPNATDVPARVPLTNTPLGIWGSVQAGRRNVLELIPEIATRQPMLSGKTGKRWHMVMDPGALKRVLRDKVEDYPKSEVTKLILEPAIGDSLFVAEGAEWLWQRRTAAPVFSHRNVAALAPVMTAAAERASARIGAATGRAADMFDEMVTATFEVISDVTFSGGGEFDRASVHKAIEVYIGGMAKVLAPRHPGCAAVGAAAGTHGRERGDARHEARGRRRHRRAPRTGRARRARPPRPPA